MRIWSCFVFFGLPFFCITPNVCVYETLGISKHRPIEKHRSQCGAETLIISTETALNYIYCYILMFIVFCHFFFNLLLRCCLPCFGLGGSFAIFDFCALASGNCKCATKSVGIFFIPYPVLPLMLFFLDIHFLNKR
jgi:hypothetical protein